MSNFKFRMRSLNLACVDCSVQCRGESRENVASPGAVWLN